MQDKARRLLAKMRNPKAWLSMRIMGLRVGNMAAKFVLSLFIARYLGLEALGIYGLVAGAAIAVPALARMGLLGVISRDVVTQEPARIVVTLTHYAAALALFYVFPVAAVAGGAFADMALPLALALLVILAEQLGNDLYVLLVSMKRPLRANVLLFTQSSGWILPYMVAALLYPEWRTIEALLSFWACGGVVAAFMGIVSFRHLPWREARWPKREWYVGHVHSAKWLWLSSVSHVASTYADRYIISASLGLEKAGIYVLFWQMGNAVATLVTTGVIQLKRPELVKAHDTGSGDFWPVYKDCCRKSMMTGVGLSFVVGVGVWVILPWLGQPALDAYLPLMWLVLLASLARLGGELASYGLFWRRRDKAFTLCAALAAVSVAFAAMAGASMAGLYGVAISTMLVHLGMIQLRRMYF